MIILKPCVCESEYQDKMYGKHIRVFNEGKGKYICTICGKERKD